MRLVLWYAVVLAIVLVVFSAVLYWSLRQTLYNQLDSDLQSESELIAQAIRISRDLTLPGNTIRELPPDAAVSVFGRSGRSIVRLSGSDLLQPSELMVQSAEQEQPAFADDTINGEQWRIYARPFTRAGQITGVIEVGQPTTEIERSLRIRLETMAIVIPLTLLLATLGGIFLSGRAMNPINRIIETVRAIQAEDLTRRVTAPDEGDEIGRLSHTFNDMLDRLEAAFSRERQFTADAAHELRTPLTLILNEVEVALNRPRSAEEYHDVLVSVEEDVNRMTALVRTLLELARSGSSTLANQRTIDLATVAADVADQYQPLAAERGLTLSCNRPKPVLVAGDPARLRLVVANLIDNAISYTPPGGTVDVLIRRKNGEATLAVRDTGSGIAPEHLPHVFERFYRVDRARSAGHAGLGLALCQAIVTEHAGHLEATSQVGQGSCFTIRLPLLRGESLRATEAPGRRADPAGNHATGTARTGEAF
jgi:heavy metal sensor kinase